MLRAAALAGLLALGAAGPVQAATVTLEYEAPIPELEPEPAYTLVVEAASGEVNRLVVARDDRGFAVRDSGGSTLAAGPRCSASAPGEVRCALVRDAAHVSAFIDVGDRGDAVSVWRVNGVELSEVLGGAGDDALGGHPGRDLLIGGAGMDVIAGQAGDDRIDGGRGADTLNGGDGRDLVTYASHSQPVTVDLRERIGSSGGARDRLAAFEDAAGGGGSDRLFGDAGSNLLYGGRAGRDVGFGRGGDDAVSVERRAVGGPGDDVVDASRVACGGGDDVAHRQRFRPSGPYEPRCERIRGFFYIVTRPRVGTRRAVLRYACPIRACRGRIEVRDGEGRLGRRRYSADGEAFGGPRSVRVSIPFARSPASRVGSLVLTGRSLARDSFRLRLR